MLPNADILIPLFILKEDASIAVKNVMTAISVIQITPLQRNRNRNRNLNLSLVLTLTHVKMAWTTAHVKVASLCILAKIVV